MLQEHMFIVALENGKMAIHDVRAERSLQQWEAHTNRVRAMELMPTVASRQDHPRLYLVTGSSDGWLKVWALQVPSTKLLSTVLRFVFLVQKSTQFNDAPTRE